MGETMVGFKRGDTVLYRNYCGFGIKTFLKGTTLSLKEGMSYVVSCENGYYRNTLYVFLTRMVLTEKIKDWPIII